MCFINHSTEFKVNEDEPNEPTTTLKGKKSHWANIREKTD